MIAERRWGLQLDFLNRQAQAPHKDQLSSPSKVPAASLSAHMQLFELADKVGAGAQLHTRRTR